MRVGEILALKWEDIFSDHIHVNRTQIRYHDENGNLIHEIRDFPKSEAGIRNVVIVPELAYVIKRLRMINPFTEYQFEKNGSCIHLDSVCTRLYNLCNRFGFERKGMHAIRRYYATKLINAGVEKIIITAQMGHADFETTTKHYYKNNSEKDYVVERISKAISG
jgi:integrase